MEPCSRTDSHPGHTWVTTRGNLHRNLPYGFTILSVHSQLLVRGI
jgi:hypothetical protein